VPLDRLNRLRAELEAAGLKPGTPEFDKEERSRKVEMCKQMKQVDSCWNCEAFDHCELIKQHLRDIYKVQAPLR